jgi:hypothetical protein
LTGAFFARGTSIFMGFVVEYMEKNGFFVGKTNSPPCGFIYKKRQTGKSLRGRCETL